MSWLEGSLNTYGEIFTPQRVSSASRRARWDQLWGTQRLWLLDVSAPGDWELGRSILIVNRFLLADPCPGSLQVQPHSTTSPTASTLSANAPAWVPLDPKEGSIIVNIGEIWQRWSGGMYPATLHQVIHRAPTYRISVPFFFEPNFDAPTSVLQAARRKCAEEGMEVKDWEGGTYGEFLLGKIRANFGYDGTK